MKYALEYQWQKGVKDGINQGIEQGILQGLELDKIAVIERMLAKEFDWKTIKMITNLTPKGYEALRVKHRR